MPELPEVETVRRMLERSVRGRVIDRVGLSGLGLRGRVKPRLPRKLRAKTILAVRRHGKYLLMDLEGGITLLSHLGMSGRWLFFGATPDRSLSHVHVRIRFQDGSSLWFQDPRRFGLVRVVTTERAFEDPSLALLGPDPLAEPPRADVLRSQSRGLRVSVKNFLLDQRRLAGIGNIYASEILHVARVDPRRRAGSLRESEWRAIARAIPRILLAAIEGMGTTFRSYRTPSNEPGGYGERLRVYDRAGEPCRRCGGSIRRIVQGQRSTYYCPRCQTATRRPVPAISAS